MVKTLVMEDEAGEAAHRADARRPQGVRPRISRARPAASASSRASPRPRSATPAIRSAAPRPSARGSRCRCTSSARSSSCRQIYINGGRRGLLVQLRTADLTQRAERHPGRRRSIVTPTNLAFGRMPIFATLTFTHGAPNSLDQQRRDALGERLDQAVMLRGGERLDAQRHLLVVDGVGDLVACEHRGAGQADVEVDGQRLRHVALAAVDADERFDAQVAEDDGIHGCGRFYRIAAMQTALAIDRCAYLLGSISFAIAGEPADAACPIRAATARRTPARPTCCAPAARPRRCSRCSATRSRAGSPSGSRSATSPSRRPSAGGWPRSSATSSRCSTASRAARASPPRPACCSASTGASASARSRPGSSSRSSCAIRRSRRSSPRSSRRSSRRSLLGLAPYFVAVL